MRNLSQMELLSLREILQMETNTLTKIRAARMAATDEQLQRLIDSSILAAEGRIKGIQQFINENRVTTTEEVH